MKNLSGFLSILLFSLLTINLQAQSEINISDQSAIDFDNMKKNALKVNAISPVFEHLEISYTRALSANRSIELSIGYIGVGLAKETETIKTENAEEKISVIDKGFLMRGGYRFYMRDFFLDNKNTIAKPMTGYYLQPEVSIGFYKKNQFQWQSSSKSHILLPKKENVNYQAILLNFGYQKAFKNNFLFDLSFGVGFANDNAPEDDSPYSVGEIHPGLFKTDGGTVGAMKSAIKIGYRF